MTIIRSKYINTTQFRQLKDDKNAIRIFFDNREAHIKRGAKSMRLKKSGKNEEMNSF